MRITRRDLNSDKEIFKTPAGPASRGMTQFKLAPPSITRLDEDSKSTHNRQSAEVFDTEYRTDLICSRSHNNKLC